MRCPERFETDRLLLRRPTASDAQRIFDEYASDPVVGKYLAWPVHEELEDTLEFLCLSDDQWERKPGGPYLILSHDETELFGSTGFDFEELDCASTGYVLARRHWGNGIATEALGTIAQIAGQIGLRRLYALCHPDHHASQNVLRKCGFRIDHTSACQCVFPNLPGNEPVDVPCFVWAGPNSRG